MMIVHDIIITVICTIIIFGIFYHVGNTMED